LQWKKRHVGSQLGRTKNNIKSKFIERKTDLMEENRLLLYFEYDIYNINSI
jgi:hypothetical protein